MFGGLIPTWKLLLGAALSIVPFAGGLYTYDRSRMPGWKKPVSAAAVYGALQLGVSYINLKLLTPSISDIASAAQNLNLPSSTGSLYLPRGGGLPRTLPMSRGGGVGLIDAALMKMAKAG